MARRERIIARTIDVVERGPGVRFTVERDGKALPAFAVRCDGVVHAYVNECAHQGVELDWPPGEFFDGEGRYLVCATHGALYAPSGGRCVAGPCKGAALAALPVVERGGAIAVVEDE